MNREGVSQVVDAGADADPRTIQLDKELESCVKLFLDTLCEFFYASSRGKRNFYHSRFS